MRRAPVGTEGRLSQDHIETGVETRLEGLDLETPEVVQPECLAAKQRVLWETEVSILTRSQKRSRSGLLAEVLGLDTAYEVTRGGLLCPGLQRLMNPDTDQDEDL